MPNTTQDSMPNNSQSDRLTVNLKIILRDFFVDVLRGRAKNSRCLSWLRFPSPRAKVRFSASSFCALASRTASHLAAIAREANLSYRTLQYWLELYRTSWLAELARNRGSTAAAFGDGSQYEQAVYRFPSA